MDQLSKDQGSKAQKGYSVFMVVLGAIMLGIGHNYRGLLCPNGAAEYLYVAGIIMLIINLVGLLIPLAQYLAEKDGKVSCGEKCGLGLLGFISCGAGIADIAILIWGSVVVFGAYPDWTHKDPLDPEGDYCHYTPFMTAFVILIIRWILFPLLVCVGCIKMCCFKKDEQTS